MNTLKDTWNAYKAINNRASGRNASLTRLVRQAVPYYFSPTGFALPPINLWLSVNTSCNLRCKMCDIGQQIPDSSFYKNIGSTSGKELSMPAVLAIANDLFPYKVNVHICCVEPLLYPHLYDAARAFVGRGMIVDLTTNGLLLAKKAEEIVDAGFRNIWLSLDGPQGVHDYIRGIEGLFAKIMEGIGKLIEIRNVKRLDYPKLNFLCVITEHNQGHLKEMVEILSRFNYERILFAHMNFVSQDIADLHNGRFEHIFHASETNVSKSNPRNVQIEIVDKELKEIADRFNGISFSPVLDKQEMIKYYHHHTEFVKRNRCFTMGSRSG
jgi:MoaA/NifB/PqqE/SkfB family radical SAM enzyme